MLDRIVGHMLYIAEQENSKNFNEGRRWFARCWARPLFRTSAQICRSGDGRGLPLPIPHRRAAHHSDLNLSKIGEVIAPQDERQPKQ